METLAKLVAIGLFTAFIGLCAGLGFWGALKIATQFWGPWNLNIKQFTHIIDTTPEATRDREGA